MQRPLSTEYPPYAELYLATIAPNIDLLKQLQLQHQSSQAFLNQISQEQSQQAYQPNKWTIQQVVAHLCDSERIMAYRALRFARGDQQELQGFDHEQYAQNHQIQDFKKLCQAWAALRQANVLMFESFDPDSQIRQGRANNGANFSVRALAYMILGHEIHHLNILRQNII